MTTAANERRTVVSASAAQTEFNFTFEIADEADIVVYQEGSLLTLTTHYTVSGVGNENGGTVTLVSGASDGDSIVMVGGEAIARIVDYTTSGDFLASSVNPREDKIFRLLQDLELGRKACLRLLDYDTTDFDSFKLPVKASRLGKIMRFNSTTGLPEMISTADLEGTTVSAFMADLLDDESATEAKATLEISIPLHKFDATTAPTANDDSGDGYEVGSIWIDVTGDRVYLCVDATLTAAVWHAMPALGAANTFAAACTFSAAVTLSSTLTLNGIATFNKPGRTTITTLTDATTIAVDFALTNDFTVTLADNRTLGEPSNQVAGQSGVFVIVQDGTGSRTLSFHADYLTVDGGGITISTGADAVDIIPYYVLADNSVLLGPVLTAFA